MKAYVDRKLFVHNLGHAVAAYVGYLKGPQMIYIWEAVARDDVRTAVFCAMGESAKALEWEYPGEFTPSDLGEHIADLVRRFGNKALGDTIYRVGRDLPRKLSPEDRLIGALRLDMKHDIEAPATMLGVAAAMLFRATDEEGNMYPADAEFVEKRLPRGPRVILSDLCQLNPRDARDLQMTDRVVAVYDELNKDN
jgi:mannitol-1-phosphate 5-dehydrogenase